MGQRFGLRPDGTPKGDGFLGALQRPDGRVSSEISISTDDFGGKDFPTLVPTLTPDEIRHLLTMNVEKGRMPDSIVEKALQFARQRQSQGKPLFAQQGEQETGLYPEFARESEIGPSTDFPLAPSHSMMQRNALVKLMKSHK